MTEYIVLVHGTGEADWMEADRVKAASADAAIRAAANGDTGDIYVAVPTRSWNPRSVTIKTETRVLVGSSA